MLPRKDFPSSGNPLMWPPRECRETSSRKLGCLAERKAGVEELILWDAR
jgi:hypothetical protein